VSCSAWRRPLSWSRRWSGVCRCPSSSAAGLAGDEVARVQQILSTCYTPWQESTFPGLLGNVVAGRIANRLDLGGTNVVVDAACASSLAAVDMAVNELALGRSDLVVTGGVDTLNDILMFMCFAQTDALSLTGDCRPFSEDADGTMLGEGIGMLVLKRPADAERDGDAIYAVIRGIGASSDGRPRASTRRWRRGRRWRFVARTSGQVMPPARSS
jgi:3-oxoacyl-(acyl-carrier-protein) synthase